MGSESNRRDVILSDVLEQLQHPAARFDAEGRYTWLNPALRELLGDVDPATVVGRRHVDLWPGVADARRLDGAVQGVLRDGRPDRVRVTWPFPDHERTFDVELYPDRAVDGTAVWGLSHDVSELARQGWALRERIKELDCLHRVSELLRSAEGGPEVLQEVVAAIAPGWQFPAITGVRLSLDGETYETAHAPGELVCSLQAPVAVGAQRLGTLTVGYAEPPPVEGDPFLDEERALLDSLAGRIASAVGRWQARVRLASRERELRLILDAVEDTIAVLDLDGRIRFANPAIARLTGRTPEALAGTDAVELVVAEDRPGLREVLAQMRDDRLETTTATARVPHDGATRTVEIRARRAPDAMEDRKIVVSVRDVTERHELEAQLRHSQKLEAVGRLAGGVAHDFNNLLLAIRLHASFLEDDLAEGDPRRDDAQGVLDAAERASRLTNQLLAFSKRQVARPRSLDLATLVGDMTRMLERLLGEDVALTVDADAGPCPVRADPGQLEQIVLNLAVNARDAMPTGGALRIACERVTLTPEEAAAHGLDAPGEAPRSWIRLRVIDGGEGMDEPTRARIFDPFFTTKETGTGLGLSTVYGIVKQHRGAIGVDSAPGEGTTFTVLLPCLEEGASVRPDRAKAPPEGRGETVLLVEDAAPVRRAMRRALRAGGYHVIDAADGAEALDRVLRRDEAVDVIVSDVVMPRMSGPELVERLREHRPDAAVLLMSGYTADALDRHGPAIDPAEILEKPFDPATLRARVRAALEGRRTPPPDRPSGRGRAS